MRFARLVLLFATLCAPVPGCGEGDSGSRDGGSRDGAVPDSDGGDTFDGGEGPDAGETPDGGEMPDGGVMPDGGETPDGWTSTCGDMLVDPATGEECDDGNATTGDGCEPDCTHTCEIDADCVDADVCNGDETCALPAHVCAPGTPPACTPADACHTAACDAATGCSMTLSDGDGDGHAPSSLGSCGTDCNDADGAVRPGATEIPGDPGSADEDCNGSVACYRNTDGDGYRTTAVVMSADLDCADSGEALASVPAGDCDDANANVSPGDPEIAANGVDDNCSGAHGCYYDNDNDGYSRSDAAIRDDSVDADCADSGEGTTAEPRTDCDDVNAGVSPGVRELCSDAIDQNCAGGADETTECPACSWSGTTRWLSHGHDGGCAVGTGVNVSCNNGRVSYVELVNTCGLMVTPPTMGAGDAQVGCTGWPGATAWLSTGTDGGGAFANGSSVTCSGGRVTNMSWEGTSGASGTFRTGDLGCNWSGAIWLSHGYDGGCAFSSGVGVTCNAGRITHMDAVGGCGWARF
jgi:cysteine-rich repeat protein